MMGTKTPEILSAISWIGALLDCASSISLIIRAIVVFAPTVSTTNSKLQDVLIVPAKTVVPIDFSTGMLSPVIIDSSILEFPNVIVPSTGTFSPGFTRMVSPSVICSTGHAIRQL